MPGKNQEKYIQQTEKFFAKIQQAAVQLISVTFSGALSEMNENQHVTQNMIPVPQGQVCQKIKCKPKNSFFFCEFFTEKQVFHKNLQKEDVVHLIRSLQPLFKNIVVGYMDGESKKQYTTSFLSNKRGEKTLLDKETPQQWACSGKDCCLAGDKTKQYIIPEGHPVPFLVYLGIMNDVGKVIQAKYDKFRQINRFLEYINDVIPSVINQREEPTENEPLEIIDFGCGKSYLTFAVHYLFTEIKKIPVRIVGLDLKEEVIKECNKIADKLGCKGLQFFVGDIAKYHNKRTARSPVDMIITLHACDTATDYALFFGIQSGARSILSVPCCQHELNNQVRFNKEVSVAPLLRYGLIKERFASLLTDALRGEILESMGYKVQMLEFIDMSHTPKNILIRAVKKQGEPCSLDQLKKNSLKVENSLLYKELHLDLTLVKLLDCSPS